MPIRKRKYKSGKTAYEVNYYDAQGKRKYKVCPTLAHARNFEDKAKKERFETKELGMKVQSDILWNSAINDFLEHSKTTWTNNTYKLHSLCAKSWSAFLAL